ncbi:MAG: hypothetical protein ACYC1Z_03365 [Georgenia sp.]
MRVEYIAGELRTGRILATVPASSGPWSQVLNSAGDVSAKVPLWDLGKADRRDLLATLETTRCFLGVQVGDRVIEAGPIWTHDLDTDGNLAVKGLGLWSLWDHRLVIPVVGEVRQGQQAWSGLSLGTIAKRLVQEALKHAGGSLPVVFPADETGIHERTYPGYEVAQVGQRLSQLVEVEGGPDLAFEPRLTSDRQAVEWVMRTGTAADPLLHQTGADHQWDTSAVRGSVGNVTASVDGTARVNRALTIGDGFETATLIGVATDTAQLDRGYPLLESVVNRSTVLKQSTLDAHSRASVDQGSVPWTTWKLRVAADEDPRLGEYRPGDWAAIEIPEDHVYLRGGSYRARLGKVSGDADDEFVDLALLPTKEHR